MKEYCKSDINIKNVNIADCFPFIKKHPYLFSLVLCIILNFGLKQESVAVVSNGLLVLIAVAVAVGFIIYMKKTVNDFVLSQRGVVITLPVVLLSVAVVSAYNGEHGIFIGAVLSFLLLLVVFSFLKLTKRLTFQNVLLLLFAVGFLVRVIYVLYTPIAEISVRQNGVFPFATKENYGFLEKFETFGHEEYIEYISKYLKLPSVNSADGVSQLYHPPFHHIISAFWLKLNREWGMNYEKAVEGLQLLTVFYSSSCMITAYKIFKELGLLGKRLFRATSLISLFPCFYIFAGSVNNDILSVALGLGAILQTIKWYKNPKILNIIFVAVLLGLSAFTKFSMVLILPAIIFVFLSKLVSLCKKQKVVISSKAGEKNVSVSYLAVSFAFFFALFIPLGFVWQIKNGTMPYFVGNGLDFNSVTKGFFELNAESVKNHFIIYGNDCNVFLGLFKTSLFGTEPFFVMDNSEDFVKIIISVIGNMACRSLYIFAFGVGILSIVSVFIFFKNKCYTLNKTLVNSLLIVSLAFFAFFVFLCFNSSFEYAVDFRHIVPFLIFPVLAFSVTSGEEKRGKPLAKRAFLRISGVFSKGFYISGVVTFVILALMPF